MMTSSCKRVGSKRERLWFLLKEGKDSERAPPIPTYKFSLVIFPFPSSQNLIPYPNTFPELITLGNLITFSSHLVILWGEDWLWSLLWFERVVKPKWNSTKPTPGLKSAIYHLSQVRGNWSLCIYLRALMSYCLCTSTLYRSLKETRKAVILFSLFFLGWF